jgi:hypothetical protein
MKIRPRLQNNEYVYTLPRGVVAVVVHGFLPWMGMGNRRVVVRVKCAAPDADKWQFEVKSGVITLKPPASFVPDHGEYVTVATPVGILLHQRS